MTAATVPAPAVTVGVLREAAPGEQRVAVVPKSLAELARAHVQVLVESGAGTAAWFGDDDYEQAGAQIVDLGSWSRGRTCSSPRASRPRS
jgi:alanine dehydrogenase